MVGFMLIIPNIGYSNPSIANAGRGEPIIKLLLHIVKNCKSCKDIKIAEPKPKLKMSYILSNPPIKLKPMKRKLQ